MAGRLRSTKVNEFSLGEAFSKVMKGLRHEINGVIVEIESRKNPTVEEMKGLFKSSLEAVVGSVEKVMSSVSDQLAAERNGREEEEGTGRKGFEG